MHKQDKDSSSGAAAAVVEEKTSTQTGGQTLVMMMAVMSVNEHGLYVVCERNVGEADDMRSVNEKAKV